MYDCLLLQYGEVGIKSRRTRPIFEKLYVSSIKECLNRNGLENFEIKNFGGRFVLYLKNPVEAIQHLKKIPGIQGISPAAHIKSNDKNEIAKWAGDLINKQGLLKNKTFGIKVKRTGNHNFKSIDLTKELAKHIYKSSKGVDLDNPDVWIRIEARMDECFFYTYSVKGIGGLPAGSSDNALCLFSGGIDSPVAAVEMLKRGCKVDFLFVNIRTEKLFYQVAKIYNYIINNFSFNYKPKFYHVNASNLIKLLKKEVPDELRQIAYKIVLYKIGELVAKKEKHIALVGGESLCQKSSQTLSSLVLIEKQVEIPMLRPLLTMDKIQITEIARAIGTFSSSEKIKEYCKLSEGAVKTSPRKKDLKDMPMHDNIIKKAIDNMQTIKFFVETPEIEKGKIPIKKDFVKIDLRSKTITNRVPLKTNLNIPFSELFERLNELDKNKTYLFVCEFGVKSEDAAYELKKKGFKAYGIKTKDFLKYFS